MTTAWGPSAAQAKFRDRYGPWATVTGASDGIGRAFARHLAQMRINLLLVARRQEVLESLAGELRTQCAIDARVCAADLQHADGVDRVLHASEDLDVGLLIAAAGSGSAGDFVDSPLARELAMIDVNCRAVAALAHAFAMRFVTQRRGGIVLMSSLLAFQGVAHSATYAATKAFVQSLAEALHIELRRRNVDVIASAPGPIRSGFGERAGMKMSIALGPDVVARTTLRALGHRATVRPGWLSVGLEWSLRVAGRGGRTRIMAGIMQRMAISEAR